MRWLHVVWLAVAACGGLDFGGTYSGLATITTTCSDGSSATTSRATEWVVTDLGDVLHIDPVGGTCGTLVADAGGSSASIRQKACPSTSAGGATSSETIGGGSLTLSGRVLSVSINSSTLITSGAGFGTCSSIATAALQR